MNRRERERNARIETWLKPGSELLSRGQATTGGIVIAATERAARTILAEISAGRREAGLEAWVTPAILSWDAWLRQLWIEHSDAGLMVLNPLQEHALWSRVIRKSQTGEALLHADRLATTAQQAYRLLASYAPASLQTKVRANWPGDSAIFSDWLTQFDSLCRREGLVSASRLAIDLAVILSDTKAGKDDRPPLLLIGFDRLLKSQIALLESWGNWRLDADKEGEGKEFESKRVAGSESETDTDRPNARFIEVQDSSSELLACVAWLREMLAADPDARLLVVAPAVERRRGELERALLAEPSTRLAADDLPKTLDFEFSLGRPLGQVGIVRSAVLLLRWLAKPLREAEVDWLLTSGHLALSAAEELRSAESMLSLRRRGLERPEWALRDFLQFATISSRRGKPLPEGLGVRLNSALARLESLPNRQSPLTWAQEATDLLQIAGWPGLRSDSSAAFQARQRWDRVLADCGSLGFDGTEMEWPQFVVAIEQATRQAIFATESTGASIQISEPLESAGQLADAIWFLGAQEDDWPGTGSPHPLLPTSLQRDAGMPHSSSAADWELAQTATVRLMNASSEIVFSYAKQVGEIESRASRLIAQLMGNPEPATIPAAAGTNRGDQAECFEDWSRIDYKLPSIAGGVATLTSQSLCAFQAFASARLAADRWEPGATGLNAKQRGILLHEVLHAVWDGGKPELPGIRTHSELLAIPDLKAFVRRIARKVMQERTSSSNERKEYAFAARFPKRYLELEVERLTRLVSEWLAYEKTRLPFAVLGREVSSHIEIAGLTLKVRLDRVDALPDGSRLIVDYKSGNIGPSAWMGDRPDDLQLPLYATYAFDQAEGRLEGLVFAQLKPGKVEFCGRVRNAPGSISLELKGQSALVRDPLTDAQLEAWRKAIERLGADFLHGRAEVDPKDPVKTCQRCHLHAVCRIHEKRPLSLELSHAEEEESIAGAGAEGNDE